MSSTYLFQGQLPDENVILFTRQHPFVLLRPLLICVAISLLPLAAYIFVPFGSLLAYLVLACLVLAILQAVKAWYSWNNTLFLLTNTRILVLIQRGFTRRKVAESGLNYIHRVTHEVDGVLANMCGYGTLTVLTDDQQTGLVMTAVPDPYDIQQEILRVLTPSAVAG